MELNDDCWTLIFNRLNIKEQVSAAFVCRRFRALLRRLWRRKYVNFSDSCVKHLLRREFSLFMRCICGTVQTMKLQHLSFERFQVLKMYTYPKVTSFSFYHRHPYTLKDDSVLEMTKMFPNLESFSPYGSFSGLYMDNWRHLRYLNLSNCEKKRFLCLEKIFERSRLRSIDLNVFRRFHKWTSRRALRNFRNLVSITVNSYELKWLAEIWQFKNLKELIIKDRDKEAPFRELLLNLHEFKSDDIIELETRVPFPFCIPPTDTFENLRRLVVRDRNIFDFNDVRDSAPNLREIIFQKCEVWESEDITFWFQNSTAFDLISMEKCPCACRILNIDVESIVQNRTNLLHFNFYENTFLELDYDVPFNSYLPITVNLEGSSPLFKFTAESTEYKYTTLRVVFR